MIRRPLLLATLLSTVTIAAASADPPAYPMICRGLVRFNHSIESSGALTVEAAFKRGAAPAGEMGKDVPQGACAWLDRGVAANESSWLRVLPMRAFTPNYTITYPTDEQGNTSVRVASDASRALSQLTLVEAFNGGTALIVARAIRLLPQHECKGSPLGGPFPSSPTACASKCLGTTGCKGFTWYGQDLKGVCSHLFGAVQCVPSKPDAWGGVK